MLKRIPTEAHPDLIEYLVAWLDAVEPDADLEEAEADACEAEDVPMRRGFGIGDEDDAEENGDCEPDVDDWDEADEPAFERRDYPTRDAHMHALHRHLKVAISRKPALDVAWESWS